MYKFFISLRYIKTRLITWFSIIGIAMGVMVLIVVLSVMDGFRKEFISRLQGVLSHLIVTVRTSDLNYVDLEKKINKIEHVRGCAPHLRGVILIGTQKYYVGGMVIGIDFEKENQISKLEDYLVTAWKEIKLWGEQLLEDNIKLPRKIELSWKVLGGGEVKADGRFPAGTRILCQQTMTIIPRGSRLLPEPLKTPEQRKQYLAYTIGSNGKIIFLEQNLPEPALKNMPVLPPPLQAKWQKFCDDMAQAINSRHLNEYLNYFDEGLRFGGGSLDPKKPFHFVPEDPAEEDIRPVIVGYELMHQLNMKRGDEITLMTGRRDPKDDKLQPFSRKFTIVGAFRSGWQEIDAHLVYTRRSDLIGFLDIPNDVNEISVSLDNYDKFSDETKDAIDVELNKENIYFFQKPYPVEKWEDRRRSLLSAINLERLIMTIIVSLIVLLAVVSIMIILILLVTEKTKDIGILKAMGAKDIGIMSIFLFNGLFISLFGALIGSSMGVCFSLNINSIADTVFEFTGFRLFPKDVYYLDKIPTELSAMNIVIITIGTLLLALHACSIPAFKAAKMDPIEALNSDSPSLNLWKRKHRVITDYKAPKGFFGVEDIVRDYVMGHQTLRILRDANLDVKEGEILVILGSSGAGKSTLLHIMGLLDTPTEGIVYHDGKNLNAYSSWTQAKIRNEDIGFIFQFYHLLPELTALENVMLGGMIRYGITEWFIKKKEVKTRAEEILKKVGLENRMNHRPVELSGGERQRVAIARALANQPKIVLCDEPTGNLDENNSTIIQELICQLNRDIQQTFVIVTHEEKIARKGHRVFRLEHGKLRQIKMENKEESENGQNGNGKAVSALEKSKQDASLFPAKLDIPKKEKSFLNVVGFVLCCVGFLVWISGVGLLISNATGIFSTFPFVGFTTIVIGAFIHAMGISLKDR